MTRLSPVVIRSGAIALVLAIAACSALPTGARKAGTNPVTKASTSTKPSSTPNVTPSLGLLIQGSLAIDARALIEAKLAQSSGNGARIVANNGSGIISDNGLGVIANNGSNYRTLAAGGAQPVEGMWVSAVGLYDGKVLAGPVATKADGSYQLGFIQAPQRNMRIVAVVPSHEKDAQYTYVTLVPPTAANVLTNDSTRLVAGMVLDVLPSLLQPYINEGKKAPLAPNPEVDSPFAVALAAELNKLGPQKLTEVDKDGAVARGVSERLASFTDLENVAFKNLYDVVEEARLFTETIPLENPPLLEQLSPMLRQGKEKEIAAFFVKRGMADAKAQDLAVRILAKGKVVEDLLLLTFMGHQDEVLSPIGELAK